MDFGVHLVTKSFRHNLLLTTNQKTFVIKVSLFAQFDTEMISENYNMRSFGHNKVISSQPVSHHQSKNFFYKSFYIWSIKYKNDIRKLKYVFIWSQIKSFRHNLFLTSNPKTSLIKVSLFAQLDTEMISENWNMCSFGLK